MRIRPLSLVVVLTIALLAGAVSSAGAATTIRSFQLVKPSNNQRVAGKFTARTTINKRFAKQAWGVEFWVDGQRVGVDRKPPFALRINSRRFSDGEHVLRASLLIKKKGSRGPDRQVCEYMRSIYLRVANGSAKASIAAKKKKKVKKAPGLALPTAIAGSKKPWKLIFRDEFSGSVLDGYKWTTQRDDWIIGGSPYNDREDAWYLPGNVSVSGGSLVQTIRHQQQDQYALTTGMINSNKRFNFKYGYIEARVKVPSCRGCWPVFWTLPEGVQWPPEMDLFEYIDTAGPQRRPFFASHWAENGVNQSNLAYFTLPCGTATDYTGKYHTYGFLWTPTKIQPYLDGVPGPAFTGAAVPQLSMYLIMTLAVGDGLVPDGTPSMRTDYIRVWQHKQ
jgi:beta-glucanase (GH16 family)